MSTDALKPDSIDPSVEVPSSLSLASSAVSDGSDSSSPPTLAALNNYKLRWEQFLVQAEPSQEAKQNTSAALQTLLKHKASMTMELLRDSGIGKVLNKLRKKVTGDDATLASQLLDSWKSTAAIAAVPTPVVAKSESATTAASSPSSSSSTGAAVATTSTVVTTESSVTIVKTDSSVTAIQTETVASSATTTTTTSSVDTLSEPASRKRKPEDSPSVTTPSKKTSLAQSILSTIDYPLPVRASTTTPSVAAPALPASDAFFAKPMTPAKSLASSSTKSVSSSSSSPAAIKSLAPIAPQRIVTPASLGPDGDLRLKIRKQISLCFMPPSPTPAAASAAPSIPEELIIIGEQIEDHLYNTICGKSASQLYRTKSRELLMNLKDSRNPELRERVLAGDIDIHTLLTAKFTDLASAALKSEREAALKWEMAERRSDVQANANSITDAWRCGKCKERKCTFYQMQTRSADEPMTTFVRCVNCGNRWKC